MTDHDTALAKVAALVSAALLNGPPALEAQLYPVALLLGPDALAGPEAVEKALREALGIAGPRADDEDQPLTCVRCWHAPASRLLVVHWRTETMRLLCADCAVIDAEDARDLPSFRMLTVLTLGAEAVARAATPAQPVKRGKRGNHGPGCQCTPCLAEPSYRAVTP